MENRRERGTQLMSDMDALRSLYNEYDLLNVELGGE